jgi:UDPglucose 6-dehydrogenase
MKIRTVGIVGQGFVGSALTKVFSCYNRVYTYDKAHKQLSTHTSVSALSHSCDVVFVCVPTPMRPDGSCDTSIVEKVCLEACGTGRQNIIVIKSTVPPGTTAKINDICVDSQVVFNPEFLLERNAEEDFRNTSRVILGGPRPATTRLRQFYTRVFPKAQIIKTDSTIAEFVKYLINSFLAAKVSIANEFSSLCREKGVDYDKVIEYAVHDERLGSSHWAVPGPDGLLGFGGSCFPKDLNALIQIAEESGVSCNTLKGAWETNLQVRPEKDWEQLKGRAVQ